MLPLNKLKYFLTCVSVCVCALSGSSTAISMTAVRGAHNYRVEAYNIKPYEEFTDPQELTKIYFLYNCSSKEYRKTLLSCLPEDDWMTACDILQSLHIRNIPGVYSGGQVTASEELDSNFFS